MRFISITQGMKDIIYTTADGNTGSIMAVVADKELEKDDCQTAVIPDCHPTVAR